MNLLEHSTYLFEAFSIDEFPPFPCPDCGHALLKDVKSRKIGEYGESKRLWDVGAINPEDRLGMFSIFLNCSSASCQAQVVLIGEDSNRCVEGYDGSPDYETYYAPRFFLPTIPLFPVSKNLPETVKGQLMLSFSHFWNDPSAGGNSLRRAMEALMDHFKIRRKRLTPKQKMHKLVLHDRISEWGKSKPEYQNLSELLLAVKWIGNAGSHQADLTKNDLVEAYKLAEHVFSEVFDTRTETLKKIAKRVNKSKGPAK